MSQKKKVKLRGPRFVSEMRSYKCPFTEETKLLHPTQWYKYLQETAKDYSLEEITYIYQEQTDGLTKKALENIMLYYHDSVLH